MHVAGLVVRCECENTIDRSLFDFLNATLAMRCEFFRVFASHSHFRISSIFSRFRIFASHENKKKIDSFAKILKFQR